MSGLRGRTLAIWDLPGTPSTADGTLVLWRSFAATGSDVWSIPRHLEERADILRSRYLAWVYDLGAERIGRRSLVERLQIRKSFSFWWMTLLVEKSNAFNSPQIVSALKLLALEDLVGDARPGRVVLDTDNVALAHSLRSWCRRQGASFHWRSGVGALERPVNARGWLRRMPHVLQAIVTLMRHLQLRGVLRKVGHECFAQSGAAVTFCSYLFNLDRRAAAEGRLATSFWTDLHKLLESDGPEANWLFMLIEHDFVPDAARARQLIQTFNEAAHGKQIHFALDSALGLAAVCGALRDYVRVRFAVAGLSQRVRFRPRDSALDFRPLFADEWRCSLVGSAAMSACIYLNLFEKSLLSIPRQRLGFYLQENIGWEMALIHAWRAAGHGLLIGVPHSTVRYWDLRYFHDRRHYQSAGTHDLPLPDLVAVNGPAARAMLEASGFPRGNIVDVEALRYLHLAETRQPREQQRADFLRVLVLGDYTKTSTQQQMSWLSAAAQVLPADTRYTVKPHPACAVRTEDYPEIQFRIVDQPLDQLLSDCDVAFTSNMTSAAVDAFIFGVPVISVLDGDALNISPLRGTEAVEYVTSPEELVKALNNVRGTQSGVRSEFFFLERALPRWRKLLRLGEHS